MTRLMKLYTFYEKNISPFQRIQKNAKLIVKSDELDLAVTIFHQVTGEDFKHFSAQAETTSVNPFLQFIRAPDSYPRHHFEFRMLENGQLILITSASKISHAFKSLKDVFSKKIGEGVHVTVNNKYSMMVGVSIKTVKNDQESQLELVSSDPELKAFLVDRESLENTDDHV